VLKTGNRIVSLLPAAIVCAFASSAAFARQRFDPARGIVLRGAGVTMDAAGTILRKGDVLVRDGKIVATWEGPKALAGTPAGDAVEIDLSPKTLIFPLPQGAHPRRRRADGCSVPLAARLLRRARAGRRPEPRSRPTHSGAGR
jgi:hypothetical protein